MKRSSFDKLLSDEYDMLIEDDRITSINTMEKPRYSPLDMREDEISTEELMAMCDEVPFGFRGKHAYLSNTAYAPFEMNGHWFLTAEHAYHFYKCKYAKDARMFEAGNPDCIQNPYEARKAGRKVIMRDGWNDMRIRVMTAIIREKFTQNEYLMSKLMDEPGFICEYNDWGDTFWGKSKVNGRYVGENHLGKILTELRTKQFTDDALEELELEIEF